MSLCRDDPWLGHDPEHGIVIFIEAQLQADPDKRWQILGYQGLLALRYRLDVHIVIVSFSRSRADRRPARTTAQHRDGEDRH